MYDNSAFKYGPYSGIPTASESLEYPEIYDLQTAWRDINDTPESAPILGIQGNGVPVTVDLDADSPHVLVNAATGGGKSVVSRSLTAQCLRNGAVATVLDVKRHSHRWANNLPNVGYAKTIPEIGNALVELGREVHRRNEIVDNFPGPIEDAPVGPRIVLLFEEMNATMAQLKEVTRRIPEGTYDAMDAFRDVVFMGRAAKVHVIAIAQMADAKSMGGGDLRECFSTRVLIRYTKNAWTMLAYDVGHPIAAPDQVGRGMVVRGGKARQTQLLYLTEEEAAAMARAPFERSASNVPVRVDTAH
jgi:DNA segregation ATPase FtsK/SpoIIIE-like protein